MSAQQKLFAASWLNPISKTIDAHDLCKIKKNIHASRRSIVPTFLEHFLFLTL